MQNITQWNLDVVVFDCVDPPGNREIKHRSLRNAEDFFNSKKEEASTLADASSFCA
jgi:hypothetical protein